MQKQALLKESTVLLMHSSSIATVEHASFGTLHKPALANWNHLECASSQVRQRDLLYSYAVCAQW